MAKTKTEKPNSLEEAGGVELLRALGRKVLGGAKGQYQRATKEARKLIEAGEEGVDKAICTAVKAHLKKCPKCRTAAGRMSATRKKKAVG